MTIKAGTQLGPYEIVSPLGVGGMGEVYRAKDSKLDREVAIKVLPDAFARDPERVARFQREAKVLASLNHPNIAAIYGFETLDDTNSSRAAGFSPRGASDLEDVTTPAEPRKLKHAAQGLSFLVMELVEGDTLAERIKSGSLDLEETLQIHKQMAEALEVAHESGVIHRDLKPANVKVTPEGKVKVLDFGLAKAMSGGEDRSQTDMANSPTITANFTRPGVIMGTAAYMSPEQARGKPIDKRTDIWSFGCVLFECLTSQMVFGGETISDSIGAILHKDPDWTTLPPNTPPTVHLLLRRCLAKDKNKRLRDIGDARVELEEAIADPTSSSLGLATAALQDVTRKKSSSLLVLIVPWLVVCVLAVALLMSQSNDSSVYNKNESVVQRFTIPVSTYAPRFGGTAISPNGDFVVYRGDPTESQWRLYIRRLNEFEEKPLAGSDNGYAPFVSVDGEWIGFFTDGNMHKVAARGGSAMRICDAVGFTTGTWNANDKIIFSTSRSGDNNLPGLSSISANGGELTILTTIDPEKGERAHYSPKILPDGTHVLFSIDFGTTKSIALLSLDTLKYNVIIEDAHIPKLLSTGHILLHQEASDSLQVVKYDLKNNKVMGNRITMEQGGIRDSFDVSQDGTLVYFPFGEDDSTAHSLVWVDRNGLPTPVMEQQNSWADPRLSPDGRRIVIRAVGAPDCILWTYDLARSTLTRLTFEGDSHSPIWDADSQSVICGLESDQLRSLYSIPVDGSTKPHLLINGKGAQTPGFGPRDSQYVVYTQEDINTNSDIWVLNRETSVAKPFLNTDFQEISPAFSPDGKWIAYTSDESGHNEIYVRPYPGPGGKIQISDGGGNGALWSRDGKELFYARDNAMIKVDVSSESSIPFGRPVKLFEANYAWGRVSNYDISLNGEKFLMVKPSNENYDTSLRVVVNWFEEVLQKFPAEK